MSKGLTAVCLLLGLLVVALNVDAWGEEGHKAIAQVAYDRLTPSAQQVVGNYLGSYSMADSAPYPDTYGESSQGRWSEPLHYCNLPKDAMEWKFSYCTIPPSCVVEAILNNTKLLQSEGTTGPACQFGGAEPCPLVFLIHFIGDIHQPLHVGYGYDRGGNEVKVTFFDKKANLHEVWDTLMIERWTPDYQTLASDLETLIQQEPSLVKQYMAVTDPNKWANESFEYVRTDVYNFTPSTGALPGEVSLGQWYYSMNLPIVKQRLIAAGVRLAALLNSIL